MRPQLDKPTLPALQHIVANIRDADCREIQAQRSEATLAGFPDEVLNHFGPFSWVVSLDGVPIAAIGATPMWPGVVSAWMFATDDFVKIRLFLTRFVRRDMIPALVRLGVHRCEARSIEGHEVAHRWLKALGAIEECRLSRYGRGGEDFLVFRWDRPDVHKDPEPAQPTAADRRTTASV